MNIVQNQNSPIAAILDGYIFMQHSLNFASMGPFFPHLLRLRTASYKIAVHET